MTTTNEQILAAGLRWLFEIEQPGDALISHLGETAAVDGNRLITFIPVAADGHPVVVVDVTNIAYRTDPRGYEVPDNPLGPDELTGLAAGLAAMGAEVARTWNGHPSVTGSLGLARLAHPSLRAAVDRYRAGCPVHPEKGVFCPCGWYAAGKAKIVTLAAGKEAGQ